MLGLAVQHLFGEIVRNVAIVPLEGFEETGRGGYEGKFTAKPRLHPFVQAQPRNPSRAKRRDAEFGF